MTSRPDHTGGRSWGGRRWLGAALLAIVTATLAGPVAAAPGDVRAVALPATDLVDGQFVEVRWNGFAADSSVNLRQCTAAPDDMGDCTSTLVNGVSRSDGTGSAIYQVVEGPVPGGFTCNHTTACTIGVFPDGGGLDAVALASLAFSPDADACPDTDLTITGSGGSAGRGAISRWQAEVCRAPHSAGVDYAAKNAIAGVHDFANGLRDFAVTSLPLSQADKDKLAEKERDYVLAPLTTSGLTFGYNLNDRRSGERVTDLVLTPDLLAEIFTGQVLNWNDPRIRELNPGWNLPTQVRPVGRADQSASTYLLTSWLDAVAQSAYRAGGPQFTGGMTIYPSTGAVDLRSGAAAVALQVARPSESSITEGYVGWMDSSTAATYGLPTVKLKAPGGGTVAATRSAIGEGVAEMDPTPDGQTLTADFAAFDSETYPLPVVSYMVAPTDHITPAQGDVFRTFLQYTATTGQGRVLPAGYAPMTGELVDASLAARERIPASAPGPSPTPTVTPGVATESPGGAGSDPPGPGVTGAPPDPGGPAGPGEAGGPAPGAAPDAASSSPSDVQSGGTSSAPTVGGEGVQDPSAAGPQQSAAQPQALVADASLGSASTLSSAAARAMLPSLTSLALLSVAAGGVVEARAARGRRRRQVVS